MPPLLLIWTPVTWHEWYSSVGTPPNTRVCTNSAALSEIDRYKESLVAYAAHSGKEMMFYERNVPLK